MRHASRESQPKHLMKRIALPIASLLAALALPSCLQQSTTIHLNKDGSGTLVEETTLGAQMTAMLDQMAGMGGGEKTDPVKEMASPEKAKARAAALGEGVTVQKVEPITVNGNKGARATFRFADINKLKYSMGSGLQDSMPKPPGGEEAEKPKEKPTTFKYAGGVLTITNPAPEKADKADKPDKTAGEEKPDPAADMSEAMEPMMKQMMGDMKMSFKVVIDSGIAETNATNVKGNTVTLAEMDMGKVMENPGAFKKLQSTDQQDPAKAMEALKGMKGITMETKPEITIKVK